MIISPIFDFEASSISLFLSTLSFTYESRTPEDRYLEIKENPPEIKIKLFINYLIFLIICRGQNFLKKGNWRLEGGGVPRFRMKPGFQIGV